MLMWSLADLDRSTGTGGGSSVLYPTAKFKGKRLQSMQQI